MSSFCLSIWHSFLESVVLRATGPVQSVLDQVISNVADTWGHYLYLVDTAEENDRLISELIYNFYCCCLNNREKKVV